jgi:hypothetical protein
MGCVFSPEAQTGGLALPRSLLKRGVAHKLRVAFGAESSKRSQLNDMHASYVEMIPLMEGGKSAVRRLVCIHQHCPKRDIPKKQRRVFRCCRECATPMCVPESLLPAISCTEVASPNKLCFVNFLHCRKGCEYVSKRCWAKGTICSPSPSIALKTRLTRQKIENNCLKQVFETYYMFSSAICLHSFQFRGHTAMLKLARQILGEISHFSAKSV